jgi:predicted acetyltransferase
MNVVKASMDYVDAYQDYTKECFEVGVDHYETAVTNAKSALKSVIDAANGIGLPDGYCPTDTFFCVEESRILGAIRFRRGDNDFIETYIGHVGYETRPSARDRGVAKMLLAYVVKNCITGRTVITCDDDNAPSIKVIESVSHRFLGKHYDDYKRTTKRKYELFSAVKSRN